MPTLEGRTTTAEMTAKVVTVLDQYEGVRVISYLVMSHWLGTLLQLCRLLEICSGSNRMCRLRDGGVVAGLSGRLRLGI